MELSEAKTKYIQKVKIKIGEYDYIELREPTSKEVVGFSENSSENAKILQQILPGCILDHSFTTNGVKASAKEVAEFIISSATLFTSIIPAWVESFSLSDKKKQN